MRFALLVLLLAAGCHKRSGDPDFGIFTESEWALIRTLSPLPPVPPDTTNAFADNPAAAALGKLYFFDPRFSGPLTSAENASPPDGNGAVGAVQKISCSRCHNPATGFSDQLSSPVNTSLAAARTGRNAPTLYNVEHNTWYFWDGRKDSLWSQALGPTESSVEHNGNRVQFALVILAHYVAGAADHDEVFGPLPAFVSTLTNAAFFNPAFPAETAPPDFAGQGRPGDSAQPGSSGFASYDNSLSPAQKLEIDRIFADFGKAIHAYERRIVSRNSAFDRFVAGDSAALSDSAQRGLKIFLGKGRCLPCHGGPNFSDNAFHNIGVRQFGPNIPATDNGRFDGVPTVLADPFRGSGSFSDDTAAGSAKLAGLTQSFSQQGAFKTPTLRSIGETGPYLHTGELTTLEEVVEFYIRGGDTSGFVGTKEITPISLSPSEKADLVEFMLSLDGEPLPPSVTAVPTLPP